MPWRAYDWYRCSFGHAALSAAVLWAALPPWDLWPLAWIAPAWWVMLIRRRDLTRSNSKTELGPPGPSRWSSALTALPRWLHFGRRPYPTLWLVGFLFWLAALHWLRLPHWTTRFGWIALCFYLAFYLPVFVGLSRVAVHQLHLPVILAAPVVWTGLELAQGHVLTGFTMASLGHTQYRWINLIQLSDLTGAYGVSFMVMLAAACLARMVPCDGRPRAFWPLLPAIAVVVAAVLYGRHRTSGEYTAPGARIALIQGSIDTQFKADSNMRKMVHGHYRLLSEEAVRKCEDLGLRPDLIVWPETMFRDALITYDENAKVPELDEYRGWTTEQFVAELKARVPETPDRLAQLARDLGVPLLMGVDRQHFGPQGPEWFNSAAFVSPSGSLLGYYDKMHLVMFGEYVPLARYLPWLQYLTPLGVNVSEGGEAAAFEVGGVLVAPNICYESVLSHVIREQVNALRAKGREPHVLVNLTNDGWFWGSSELQMHLICGVFRAVECRKPFLVAANTGISAWIDGDGRIRDRGPQRHKGPQRDAGESPDGVDARRRRAWTLQYGDWPKGTAKILAHVRVDRRESWYLKHGDWPAGMCLVACGVFAAAGCWARWGSRRRFRSETGRKRPR